MTDAPLQIGSFSFQSRLFAGTGKYPNASTARQALEASGCEVVTVAVRRVDLKDRGSESILGILLEGGYTILPNTAGCYTVEDALRTGEVDREELCHVAVFIDVGRIRRHE